MTKKSPTELDTINDLLSALARCTADGIFDKMVGFEDPQIINKFCDMVTAYRTHITGNISCEEARSRISEWLLGETTITDTAEVEKHLLHCDDCVSIAEKTRKVFDSILENR